MEVREIKAKTLLNKSRIAYYCINPYVGCENACKYCYADYYTRRIYKIDKSWGEYVYVKTNSPIVLEKDIRRNKVGSVYISSLTDSYQRLEKKYELTRRILELLIKNNWPVIVQTKSSLILRDIELIKKSQDVTVGVTITSLEKEIVEKFEKLASSVDERIKILKETRENKIKNYLFLGPIIPFTEKEKIEEIVKTTKDFTDEYYFDKLNIRGFSQDKIKEFLPDGKTIEDLEAYFKNVKKWVKEIIEKNKIKANILF